MCGKGTLRGIVARRYERLAHAAQSVAWASGHHETMPSPGIAGILAYWDAETRDSRSAYGQALRLYERLLRKEDVTCGK